MKYVSRISNSFVFKLNTVRKKVNYEITILRSQNMFKKGKCNISFDFNVDKTRNEFEDQKTVEKTHSFFHWIQSRLWKLGSKY